jgi:hypothetical protein
MPTKQSKRQALREARAKAARQEQIIKWAAIGVMAVIVIAILWSVLPTKSKTPEGLTIDVNKKYFATVKMKNGGEFVIQLFPDKAPSLWTISSNWRALASTMGRPSTASLTGSWRRAATRRERARADLATPSRMNSAT